MITRNILLNAAVISSLWACLKAQPVEKIGADASADSTVGTCPSSSIRQAAEAVIETKCTICHATQSPLMKTAEQITAQGAAIVSAAETGRMPPGGGLAEADLLALQAWSDSGFASLHLALQTPTYEDTIKPMILAKCASCHSATAAADRRQTPYLTSYANVKSGSKDIYALMSQGKMPPRNALPVLNAADLTNFAAWRSGGFPPGTPLTPVPADQPVYYLGALDSVLASYCTGCHAPGIIAPDLSSYQAVETLGGLVVNAVQTGKMPPSGPLSSALQAEFKAWAAGGYPYDAEGSIAPPVADPSIPVTDCP